MLWSLALRYRLDISRHLVTIGFGASTEQSAEVPSLLQGKVQEGDVQLSRLQTALQSQQTRNNQLQNTLQATEAQLQEANALTNAERLRVTLLQEAASAREAAVQLLHQQLEDAEQKVQQQGLELQVRLIELHGCSITFASGQGLLHELY